jgi:hypothetical protein
MTGITKKSFETPDETRAPAKTRVEVVALGPAKAARFTLEPGWRWSECIKPVVDTESCQARHVGVVISGGLRVVHNDGAQADLASGDAYSIEPGHDAWVISDEPFKAYEFESTTAESYGTPG